MRKRHLEHWKIYELFVARLVANQIATGLCVTPNARVTGQITKVRRQLDVLIDARHNTDNSRRIIFDAKKRIRKIDVPQVEAFKGLMEDVGATHGYLVCPSGHTKAAKRRAQESISISLIPLDRLQDFDPTTWEKCRNSKCKNGLIFWDGYPELSMRLSPVSTTSESKPKTVR